MEQGTPIPLRRISVVTNFIARSNHPSRAYCPPSGGAGFRVEQDTGLATCGGSKRRNFRAGSKAPVRALTARRLGKLSICYATHSLLCDALLQPHGPLGKCPRNEGISDHASRMSQVIPTPASLRGASCFGCNKPPAVPVLDRKARNAAMFRPRFNSARKPPRTKRRL